MMRCTLVRPDLPDSPIHAYLSLIDGPQLTDRSGRDAMIRYARLAALTASLSALAACVSGPPSAPVELLGVACSSPPPVHCPDASCPATIVQSPGNQLGVPLSRH